MRNYKPLIILFICSLTTLSCFEDNDDNLVTSSEINDFIWKGMNTFYLYKENIPNLSNDRFTTNEAYASYLNTYSTPEDLFESLIHQRETVDKYSWIVNDYLALEQYLGGCAIINGMEYSLFKAPDSPSNIFGVVRMVIAGSDAENKGLKRGDIFYEINGTQLFYNSETDHNLNSLNTDTYTLTLGSYNTNGTEETTDDTINPKNESITLNKLELCKNPIFKTKIFNIGNKKVGYLMYNGFTAKYNSELNNVFANFKTNNVQDLVLDLRYNPGGSVNSAILLASMITGQLTGDIFSKEEWNAQFQTAFEKENPELLINRFVDNDNGTKLNSLNLSKVYILATKFSASASELVINSLDPHINVIHIGENTAGKYQASTTLYDSDDFGKQGANPNHTYAMQPLIFKSLNSVGNTDYYNGLTPDINLNENHLNLGVLGDENETLLAAALDAIKNGTGKTSLIKPDHFIELQKISHFETTNTGMYIENKIPAHLIKTKLFEQN